MNTINLWRYSDGGASTLGLIFLNSIFTAYTLEDTHHDVKIPGQTRIPEGTYQVKINKDVGMNSIYAQRFPDIHKGMLEITDVPGFTYILLHEGNWAEDTEGCVLIGNTANNNKQVKGMVGDCDPAYRAVYSQVIAWLEAGNEVWIQVGTIEPIQSK